MRGMLEYGSRRWLHRSLVTAWHILLLSMSASAIMCIFGHLYPALGFGLALFLVVRGVCRKLCLSRI